MFYLKYIILAFIVLNIPEIAVRNLGTTIGTISSYSLFIFLLLYFLFKKDRGKVNVPLVVVGFLYYIISSFQSQWALGTFAFHAIKFFIVIICANEVARDTTPKELSFLFVIGAISIILHPFLFEDNYYGRYSGFYFNPNSGAYAAITAFALTFSYKKGLLKLGKTLLSSFGGLMTFSRTFVILWVLMNLLSIRLNIKNLRIIGYGIIALIVIVSLKDTLGLNTKRIDEFTALANNDQRGAKGLTEDSRTATWSHYYNLIYKKPLFGNGFHYFQGGHISSIKVGVHNSFLLILGEAGVLPFIFFVLYIVYLLTQSYKRFMKAPYLFMMTMALTATLLADHGFFYLPIFPFVTMWIHNQINIEKEKESDINLKPMLTT
ncbi:O-antigen ligase family protein [Seonamhaeicola marinus]|uniref:O-antigen ligase family protein n=1 Tax=Seonamhaeicola marinus TaxID=1912246 RepID=A0A5D0HKM8_9FLAO|nr:O-antigen ligase family protein [Seonamhaeicola marinus]TYA71866.1 O-antigen ligase family protein [Seonamhaeicola marinus]